MSLHHCRVVLVAPHYAGNIGATARAMRNFGFQDLVLVTPHVDRLERQACQMATHGEEILRRARVVGSFEEAVGECVLVVGTSAKAGGLFRKQPVGAPHQIVPHIVDILRGDNSAALVFGPEPNGLTNEMISRCHYVVQIPADDAYPSLNLAQAVAICLYVLRISWLTTSPDPRTATRQRDNDKLADFAAQEQLFARLRNALERIHFVYGDKGDALMHAVRHLLGKARLTVMEVKLLLGLARQIQWFVENRDKTK